MKDSIKKIRVCIIGGGAAGLCALRHFSKDLNIFEIEAYEQTGNIGGTWVYSENTGFDENGLPIHSSMYRDLRTNSACEIMNYPDFRKMKGDKASFVGHETILSYLHDYADHFQIRNFIKFYMKVETVRPETIQTDNQQIIVWHVQIKNLKTKEIAQKEFDAVIVGNGQYSDPNIPEIPGIETFPGRQFHSHTFRKSEEFSGKTVIVLGAGVSGVDIGVEVSEHADKVYLSHNREKITARLHPSMIQVAGIERVERKEFFLKDGNSITADDLIYCTGYTQTFPFLDESCRIKVDDNYVYPLYKHTINVHFPTMCFMGINTFVVSFNMFHVKAQYFQALLKKQFALPSKEEMLKDSTLKTSKKWQAHNLGLKQYNFYDSLTQEAGLEPLPAFYRKAFEIYTQYRKYDLLHYKEAKIILSEDDTNVRHINHR